MIQVVAITALTMLAACTRPLPSTAPPAPIPEQDYVDGLARQGIIRLPDNRPPSKHAKR